MKKFSLNIPEWLKDGTESILWNILGNLIPIWLGIAISIYNFGFKINKIYDAIHQPYTFLILSASYLTTSYYIINRKGSFIKPKSFQFVFFILLLIIGYIVKDRKSLEDLSASKSQEVTVIVVFIISFSLYLYYELKFHKSIEKTTSIKESNLQYNELSESFKNFTEDEQ